MLTGEGAHIQVGSLTCGTVVVDSTSYKRNTTGFKVRIRRVNYQSQSMTKALKPDTHLYALWVQDMASVC